MVHPSRFIGYTTRFRVVLRRGCG